MLPEVRALMDVQELDNEVLELKEQLAKYPVIWDEVKNRLAKAKEATERAVANEERHKRDRTRVEQRLRMFSDELRRNQAQQSTIKTTKEYEALNKQIEGLKMKISSLEEQGLELISKDGEVEEAVKTARAALKEIESVYLTEKSRIREQFNEKKGRLTGLETERARLAGKVDAAVLATYDRIFKRHPGSAIVPVRSTTQGTSRTGCCGGCQFRLVPNDLVQVHRAERMVTCPNCGRILSEDEDYQPEEHANAG